MDCSRLFEIASAPLAGLAKPWAGFGSWVAGGSPLTIPLAQASEITSSAEQTGVSLQQWLAIATALAVMIVPFILGRLFARSMKMPNYGLRFGCVFLAILASTVVLFNKLPGLGIDLSGGTILVYEIDPSKSGLSGQELGGRISSRDFVEPLTRRINPAGTQEIVIRPYGESQIEIIVPEVDQREVGRIKQLVEDAGILRFAIVANQFDHKTLIDQAAEQADSPDAGLRTSETVGSPDDLRYGRWVSVGRESAQTDEGRPLRVDVTGAITRNPDTGAIFWDRRSETSTLPPSLGGADAQDRTARWIDAQEMSGLEVLMVIEPLLDIKGEDLAFASSTFDEAGRPAVAFNLTDAGSPRFAALTANNAPQGSRERQLGIILDDELLSAPAIRQSISRQGRITGNFTRDEVNRLVQILKAGQLPAALTPQPIAESQIGATLGADTIRKGVWAIGVSLILVLVFILIYYRFVGMIACFALVLNLAMILATMVLINQPLTLPGLAGLVLTVGMSVDANVLIFERIREELNKGAKSRMAIRNGFARATTTIVDANLTTLITAIVLYAIGTDQIRGFAVTLILGILFSMFTAIYMSRGLFDLAERHGFLSLSMSDLVNSLRNTLAGGGEIDFIGKGKLALACSAVLMVIGVVALFGRGQGIFDIDFAGGSSVQFQLDEPIPTDTVRQIVGDALATSEDKSVPFTVSGVSIDGIPEQTVYKVDCSNNELIQDVDQLKKAIETGFAANPAVGLVTYAVTISPDDQSPRQPADGASYSGPQTAIMLTAWQPPTGTAADPAANGDAATTAEGTPVGNGTAGKAAGQSTGDSASLEASPVTVRTVELGIEGGQGDATINAKTLLASLVEAAAEAGVSINDRAIELKPVGEGAKNWEKQSSLTFSKWTVSLPLAADQADAVINQLKSSLESEAVWISSSSVGARVAGDMVGRAIGALFASLLCIIGYIWFRFQKVMYGFAAVAALVHDVLITLGAIAISYWLADALGFLLIDQFKISLTVVAALLTIIGYSLNDTIVVFDRIRETKGKAPKLTSQMVNNSINQTLSRTLLTSVTTLIVVVLLYAFGGEGIHAFAFALVVGVIAGTYSSVFVASPILLWLLNRKDPAVA